uniref:Cytochrome P450 76C8 n=1 Tax=Isatis tinctoria TaxID=161756 RepID=A0A8F0FT48_ISATI|nr:cytochrome P450 76C8 [Isatis tinctoria]
MKNTIAPALLLILSFLLTYLLFATIKSRRRSSSPLPLEPPEPPGPPGPPGPLGWPIIGLLHIIGKAPHRSLANLSRVYGPVMSLRLGSLTTVVISSPEAAREVLKTLDNVFSARTFSETVRTIGHQEDVSIPWLPSTSSHWRLWRKILESQLFSRKCLKATMTVRSKKVKELIKFIIESSERGEAVEIARACFVTSLNVISNVVFSTDLGSYDPRASLELRDSLFRIMEIMGKPNLANYFPSLGFLDLQGIRKEMKTCSERLFRVFQGLIDARIAERSSRAGPRDAYRTDLLDSLIDLIQEDGSEVDMNDIKYFLYDLFIAGTETNSTTVEWAMVELLRNPEAMSNAKVEINFIVGPNRYVRDSDLLDFPYLQAVVTETLRLHPPSPFLIPRKAESDIEVSGFLVPENAQILVNAWAIGRDSRVWENAERFEPERFLGRDLESIGKDFEMIPFGAGRRMCPGISLALRIVPHMLASLIYSFEWALENEKNYAVPADLDLHETFGLTLHKTSPLYSDFVKKAYEYFY